MWNRKDLIVLAATAAATFGMTLATAWPRLANAVGETPAAVANVKVPALDLGQSQVTAALDPAKPRTVLLTVKNLTDEPVVAEFVATAMVSSPGTAVSRVGPIAQPVWSEEYSLELKAGETITVPATLPSSAFESTTTAAQQNTRVAIPGMSYLNLAAKNQPARTISALNLRVPAPAPAPVAVVAKAAPKAAS
jgi:hypothetical protein